MNNLISLSADKCCSSSDSPCRRLTTSANAMTTSRHSAVLLNDGPIVRLNFGSVSKDLDNVRGLIKIIRDESRNVDRWLAKKVGVAIIYIITYEQIQGGIEPIVRNIKRELDQYYYSLADKELTISLQLGIDESIDVAKKLYSDGELEWLKYELRKLVNDWCNQRK